MRRREPRHSPLLLCVLQICSIVLAATVPSALAQSGFLKGGWGHTSTSPFGEEIRRDTLSDGVRLTVVAPPLPRRSTLNAIRLILYALPNGNTTEHTMGREVRREGEWRYGIQHIGAQSRMLRAVCTDAAIVVAYLEAPGLSWPAWRRQREESGTAIRHIVDCVRSRVDGIGVQVSLSGHSGGGSFIFGFIDGGESIPGWVERISFLDSNYGFSVEAGHAHKLLDWLTGDSARYLSCIAYDDREIVLDGKKVVGPDGGTYRRSLEMVTALRTVISLPETTDGAFRIFRDVGRRVELMIHTNPENAILHTRLVERNGFLHAMTSGTAWESRGWRLWGAPAYAAWIER